MDWKHCFEATGAGIEESIINDLSTEACSLRLKTTILKEIDGK